MSVLVKRAGVYTEALGVFVKAGGTYQAATVFSKIGGQYLQAQEPTPAPPAFTVQPSPQTVDEGQTATFGPVSVTGYPAPTLQWQVDTGGGFADIDGATSASYTTPTLALADSGNLYRCVATNTEGTANSNSADLTVNAAGEGLAVDEAASTGVTFSTITAGDTDYRVARIEVGGSLVVTRGGDVEWLGVAGGGPGGSPNAGFSGAAGGGAGGLRKFVAGETGNTEAGPLTLGVNTYTISVGAGGTPAQGAGTNGADTTISGPDITTLTCVGGGRGAAEDGAEANGGGSGGGGAFSAGTGGAGTSGQGNAGATIEFGLGGGGGGAGAAGTQPNGGDGIESSIDGTPTYYAGGGGGADGPFDPNGGTGGLGGGGAGGEDGARTGGNGVDGLGGGGGGGAGSSNLGGSGGRGVFILRWPI